MAGALVIFAIDPGPVRSAWCEFDGSTIRANISKNEELLEVVRKGIDASFCIEMIASYGMPVGAEVFNTCVWIGRFIEAAGKPARLVYRKDVKMHLCGQMKAKDANIRQALIDRFGKPGTKKQPGLTYGLAADMWAALAVAVTAHDTRY